MAEKTQFRFAFHFDLAEARLKEHYPSQSATGYKQAWTDIRSFLESKGFTHTQYSGYESIQEMSYAAAYATMEELHYRFSWFTECAQGATLTEIGERYDVLAYFRQQAIGRQPILQPAEHEIVQASLTLAEQGHPQFTLSNESAAQVLDQPRAALEQEPKSITKPKPKTRADLAAKIQAQTQAKLEQKTETIKATKPPLKPKQSR